MVTYMPKIITFNATESTHTKGLYKLWALGGDEASTSVG